MSLTGTLRRRQFMAASGGKAEVTGAVQIARDEIKLDQRYPSP
jgi:hypothetical protein